MIRRLKIPFKHVLGVLSLLALWFFVAFWLKDFLLNEQNQRRPTASVLIDVGKPLPASLNWSELSIVKKVPKIEAQLELNHCAKGTSLQFQLSEPMDRNWLLQKIGPTVKLELSKTRYLQQDGDSLPNEIEQQNSRAENSTLTTEVSYRAMIVPQQLGLEVPAYASFKERRDKIIQLAIRLGSSFITCEDLVCRCNQ